MPAKNHEKQCRDLNISFVFEITHFQNRCLRVVLHKTLADVNKIRLQTLFGIFMEDLVYYVSQNKIQPKWDIEKMEVSNLRNLGLKGQDTVRFLQNFVSVTNWKVRGRV